MFVILSYDINATRVGKAKKICRKYLNHVQKSVFDGAITEGQLKRFSGCWILDMQKSVYMNYMK